MAHVEALQVHQQRPGGDGPAIGGGRLLCQSQAFLANVQSLKSRGRCGCRFEVLVYSDPYAISQHCTSQSHYHAQTACQFFLFYFCRKKVYFSKLSFNLGRNVKAYMRHTMEKKKNLVMIKNLFTTNKNIPKTL